jgi:hypothetical protein
MESRERDGAYTYTFIGVSGEQSSFITNFHMEQLSDPDGFENEESIGKRFSLEWEKVNMNGEMVKKIVHLEQAELEEEAPEEGDDEETPNEGNGGEEETEAPANEPEGTNEETPDNP